MGFDARVRYEAIHAFRESRNDLRTAHFIRIHSIYSYHSDNSRIGKEGEKVSRIPIVNLIKGTIFAIGSIYKMIFYYFPLWMMGNNWCDSCMKIIKKHEPFYEHSNQAEDFHLCQECEDEE